MSIKCWKSLFLKYADPSQATSMQALQARHSRVSMLGQAIEEGTAAGHAVVLDDGFHGGFDAGSPWQTLKGR